MKKAAVTLIAFALLFRVSAQDSTTYSTLAASIGVNNILLKDKFQPSNKNEGLNFLLKINYTKVKPNDIHTVNLSYTSSALKSVTAQKDKVQIFYFNYNHLFKLKTRSERFSSFIGAGINGILSNTNYLPEVPESKENFSGSASIAAAGRASYRINKKSNLDFNVNFSLLGIAYRPDFNFDKKTSTGKNVFTKNPWTSATLNYEYKISDHYLLTAGYWFDYFMYDRQSSISIVQNGMTVGIKKKF